MVTCSECAFCGHREKHSRVCRRVEQPVSGRAIYSKKNKKAIRKDQAVPGYEERAVVSY